MSDAVSSFPPIVGPRPRVLVLGSMPGVASLRAGQYYAHPHNAFWPILGELLGASPQLDYPRRCRVLAKRGIAVWDVLHSCVRPGSLDSDIAPEGLVANDFAAFYKAHPTVGAVFCNGGKALSCYRRHVLPQLTGAAAALPVMQLPSTSPAHASQSFAEKLRHWRAVAAALQR